MSPADPFRTAELRRTVLDAWAASPARFREDANAEEDYALGGYRDRLVVELAQNAADAASRAGEPGRLRLTLSGEMLTAANTGAPLDAAGVEALSTLRASGKRDTSTVGRFGVGFAATVAVSDAPEIASATGAVRWSRAETRDLAAGIPALAGELTARSGHVPALRLPFPSDATPPDGFTTIVTLPLRDPAAVDLVTRLLAETGPALLLALPALAAVTITTGAGTRQLTASRAGDDVTVTADRLSNRWRVAAAGGALDPGLLADRPTEEKARTAWSVRWAVPLMPADDSARPPRTAEGAAVPSGQLPGAVSAVVHAPTPTDEPLALPALLLASFPLSPDRRHVAPGPLTGFLIDRAAEAYARLLPRMTPGPGLLDLVPGPVAHGQLDGRLRRAILALLPDTPFLPVVDSGDAADSGDASEAGREPARLRPRDALLLDTDLPGLTRFLAPVLAGLVPGPARHPAYRALGVRRLSLAELTDTLAALDRPPSWWRGLYEALSAADPAQRAELGALPVPLADGRLVRGPRGLLLPGTGLEHPDRLAVLGLRVVDPDAAHPLLARLGAVEATPRGVLADPATRAAVENSLDEEDPAPVAEAVLGLVAAADLEPGELPWLGNLALPGEDEDWYPADELLIPGSALAEVVAPDAPFGVAEAEFAARHGDGALEAAGVLSTFGLLRAEEVDLGDPDLDVDGADDWADDVRARLPGGAAPPFAPEVLAVRDLDLVDPSRWPRALGLLSRPPLRAALVEPARVLLGDGRYADVPSYTAWWLRRHLTVGGQRPGGVRAPDSDPLLAGLYDEAVPELAAALADPEIARALGVRTALSDVLGEPGGPDDLLRRMADPARAIARPQLRALWAALGRAAGASTGQRSSQATTARITPADVTPPERMRAVRGDTVVVADADDVLVLDSPDLWPLAAARPLVLAPHDLAFRLADLLDLPLASEEIAGAVESSGERQPVPDAVTAVLPDTPSHYYAHGKLLVDGAAVAWRVVDGDVHAADPAGLACALAWAAGQWPARHLLTALLTTPDESARLLADADLDPA